MTTLGGEIILEFEEHDEAPYVTCKLLGHGGFVEADSVEVTDDYHEIANHLALALRNINARRQASRADAPASELADEYGSKS